MADLLLHIADRNQPKPAHFNDYADQPNEIVVLNKSDLAEHKDWTGSKAVNISCKTGQGIADLEKAILARVSGENLRPENSVAINLRHRDCLRRALESCDRARAAMSKGVSSEYIAVDLNDAVQTVGEIIGTVDVEQILDSVFAQFCIGK